MSSVHSHCLLLGNHFLLPYLSPVIIIAACSLLAGGVLKKFSLHFVHPLGGMIIKLGMHLHEDE